MIFRGIRLARPADSIALSDLTASVRTGPAYWEPGDVLVMPLKPEPTAAEAAAIRRRLVTADADEEARVKQLETDAASSSTPTSVRGLIRAELARYGGG